MALKKQRADGRRIDDSISNNSLRFDVRGAAAQEKEGKKNTAWSYRVS
jgi:hypothetical protein